MLNGSEMTVFSQQKRWSENLNGSDGACGSIMVGRILGKQQWKGSSQRKDNNNRDRDNAGYGSGRAATEHVDGVRRSKKERLRKLGIMVEGEGKGCGQGWMRVKQAASPERG